MQYRREIDGLRAVAVLPVLFFHAGFSVFGGGYVGVDVFFVISGYLITTILLEDIGRGKFSLLRFYERRARRILPALFFVMLLCLPLAWAWMLPVQLKNFGQSLVAVSLFASNFLFWSESGYFSAAAEEKPLLHTWSLAVEEQYYLLFPLLLLILWPMGLRRGGLIIISLALISLGLSEWGWRNAPSATFYLFPSRMWELLSGSLCAFVLFNRAAKPNTYLASAGLMMILISIFVYDASTPFPSLYTVLPVSGTALVILYAHQGTSAADLLSRPICVGLGLISYSLYLWHQPLFAFARIRLPDPPSPVVMAGLIGLAIVLAWLSWRFVERPFRKANGLGRARIFQISTIGLAGFMAFGVLTHLQSGFPNRIAPSGQSYATLGVVQKQSSNRGLHLECRRKFTLSSNCRTAAEPQVLLWGDSHAMHLAQALTMGKNPVDIIQHTKSACGPILGLSVLSTRYPEAWARDCIAFNDAVYDWLKTADHVEYVILASPLTLALGDLYHRQEKQLSHDQPERVAMALRETAKQIRALGKKPIFVSSPPRTGRDFGKCLAHVSVFDLPEATCDFAAQDFSRETVSSHTILDQVTQDIPAFRLDELICPNGSCDILRDGIWLYRDDQHLSAEGSQFIGKAHGLAQMIIQQADLFNASRDQ